MKHFALIATGLALLSAGAGAQETASKTSSVKVTIGTVVTNYSISPRVNKYSVSCTDGAIYDSTKNETRSQGKTHIEYGESFDIYAGRTLIKTLENGTVLITLQSDGKIESLEDGHKVTQFVADGTTIEFLPGR